MKIFNIIFLSFIFSSFAQSPSNLVMISGTNQAFTLEVDHHPINKYTLKEVRVKNIPPGYHQIHIKFAGNSKMLQKRIYIPPASEIVWEIYPSDYRNPKGIFIIKDIFPSDESSGYYQPNLVFDWYQQNPGQNSGAGNIQNGQINININNQISNPPSGTQVWVPGYQGNIGCPKPVSPEKFSNMLNTVEEQAFESSKLLTAKQIIKYNNCLTVNQLVQIMELFSFDKDKLKLAKYAYHYIYDIDDIYKVNNVFDFDDTKEKFARYIEQQE